MPRVVNYLPTINLQNRAIKHIPKKDINKLLLPNLKEIKPSVRDVLISVLKQQEMKMADLYSYIHRIESEIDDFHATHRTVRDNIAELKSAGLVKDRLCECGLVNYYSYKK